jgi:Flp pilus assembly protein TadD
MPGRIARRFLGPLLAISLTPVVKAQIPRAAFDAKVLSVNPITGQILLPTGEPPRETLSFSLSSDDGTFHAMGTTSLKGSFHFDNLDPNQSYTLLIPGDGHLYESTIVHFSPADTSTLRIVLRPGRPERGQPAYTVSAASGYKPVAEAARLYKKGIEAGRKKHLDESEALLRRAIALDSRFAAPRNDLAALLMNRKEYGEAEGLLREALAVDPQFVEALTNLGIILNKKHEFASAIEPLRAAVRYADHLLGAHLQLGIALAETGAVAEGERELRRAAEVRWAEESVARLALGKLYARIGEKGKAVTELEVFLKESPSSPNAAKVRALLDELRASLAARR